MTPTTIEQAMQIALGHHQAGRLAEAERLYRQVLARTPDHAPALHFLGILVGQTGDLARAIDLVRRSIALAPAVAEFHGNLGELYCRTGQWDEALETCRRAVELNPELAAAHVNLGMALKATGRLDEAIAACRRAIALSPGRGDIYCNLGNVLSARGRTDEAIAAYQHALALSGENLVVLRCLGVALHEAARFDETVAVYERTLALDPADAGAHINLGVTLYELGRLDEAAARLETAIALAPQNAEAHDNLGSVFKDQGRLDEALVCYRKAAALRPGWSQPASNLVFTMQFHPAQDADAVRAESRRWDALFARPLAASIRPLAHDRAPDRRLRIGYLSPDFHAHPVGRFLLPLLDAHDHDRFEIFCYNNARRTDVVTACCRARADAWREIADLSDDQAAHAIRQDQIDILVDLAMHTAGNRLLVFARKPAPVQVTYLAYCGTTGLSTMDYRLTDPYLDPPGRDESSYSEQLIRLHETYWCYEPVIATPEPDPPPALHAGHITFGCLNAFAKVTAPTLEAWSHLLRALPGARLLLHAHAGSHRDRVREYLEQRGVARDRLTFLGRAPLAEYLGTYQRIDVALDPFPFGGGTTTCDALWMGVPVVTLAGETAVGRAGVSILSNVGLRELVAQDVPEYVGIALRLAQDLPRLAALRSTLRARMRRSPLMNASRFARGVEAAYRTMWQRWCGRA